MGEELAKLFDSAMDVILTASVIIIAVMFLNLRRDYADVVEQSQINTYELKTVMETSAYDMQALTGIQAIECITNFYTRYPVWVDREYDSALGAASRKTNVLYTPVTVASDSSMLKMGLSQVDGVGIGMTTRFLPGDVYYAIFYRGVYTAAMMPEFINQLNTDTGFSDIESRIAEVQARYAAINSEPTDEVSAVILICISKTGSGAGDSDSV